MAALPRRARILFIDAYDSFAHNIIAVIKAEASAEVYAIRIDDERFVSNDADFVKFLKSFDGVVAGPGPGDPRLKECVGLFSSLWKLEHDDQIPILGICLGFQSLAQHLGARIEQLTEPKHGLVTEIHHNQREIFKHSGDVTGVLYHSLHAHIGHAVQTPEGVKTIGDLWEPSRQCQWLVPIAWDFGSSKNGPVLMGCKHTFKPYWGVQFHPESSKCNVEARKILQTFVGEALRWNNRRRKGRVPKPLLSAETSFFQRVRGHAIAPENHQYNMLPQEAGWEPFGRRVLQDTQWKWVDLTGTDHVRRILRALKVEDNECIVLESAAKATTGKPLYPETGTRSIIGLVIPGKTMRLCWYAKSQKLEVRNGEDQIMYTYEPADVWSYIKTLLNHFKVFSGPPLSPFWGGLMGFCTYEGGLPSIGVPPPKPDALKRHPDMIWAFITRSVVIDHVANTAYVQTLEKRDEAWCGRTTRSIKAAMTAPLEPRLPTQISCQMAATVANEIPPSGLGWSADSIETEVIEHHQREALNITPEKEPYKKKVESCQDLIRKGWCYQLCLTDQTVSLVPTAVKETYMPWHLYEILRAQNPAPFGAFIRIGKDGRGVNIISSSPERFVTWTRDDRCQFRPIKGTLKKTDAGISLAEAEAILNNPKDQAENLMISDLIRHDLHGIIGAGNVAEPRVQVEEYASVFQLVSVINGDFSESKVEIAEEVITGVDILAASLPPGSMTGAPKKQACECLKDIEDGKPRGIYSGVIGYMDLGGGGDFSVVIRTAYKWDNESRRYYENRHRVCDKWHIGAGGAVTALSTPEGEFEEMVTKQQSVLNAFKLETTADQVLFERLNIGGTARLDKPGNPTKPGESEEPSEPGMPGDSKAAL